MLPSPLYCILLLGGGVCNSTLHCRSPPGPGRIGICTITWAPHPAWRGTPVGSVVRGLGACSWHSVAMQGPASCVVPYPPEPHAPGICGGGVVHMVRRTTPCEQLPPTRCTIHRGIGSHVLVTRHMPLSYRVASNVAVLHCQQLGSGEVLDSTVVLCYNIGPVVPRYSPPQGDPP